MADLRNSGLAHIISISGLHMALVAGTFFVVLRMLLALLPRVVHSVSIKKVAAIGALAVSTFYLIISGASVPTQRSWIMLAIMLVAVLIDRPAFTLRNVAIAAICIIAVSPSSVVGPSFQMSFAATAALVPAFGALSGWRARRNRGTMDHEAPWWKTAWLLVAATVFTSAVAGAATALFAAYHFHRLTSLGILGNLFATPVVSLVVMPMGLLSVLLMPYGLETWPLKAMGFGLDMVLAIAHHVASLGGIVNTGRIPTLAALVIGAGLLVLILMRSRLRLTGIAIIAAGCMMTFPPFAAAPPDILISEDGTLVSIVTSHGLAANRERPSTFVFDQWLSAMGATDKVSPRTEDVPVDAAAERAREAPARVAASPNLIDRMRSMLQTSADQRFTCFGKIWCGATFDDVSLITVSDAAYLGPACDLAKIVVTPEHVRMTQCRSGALLLTGRTLRRTGSVEVYIPDKGGRPDNDAASSQSDPQGLAVGASDGEMSTEDLRVVAALDHIIRPWTIHRYYDWHTRSFDFSNGKPPVADLQSKQSFNTGRSNGSGL